MIDESKFTPEQLERVKKIAAAAADEYGKLLEKYYPLTMSEQVIVMLLEAYQIGFNTGAKATVAAAVTVSEMKEDETKRSQDNPGATKH